MSIRTAVRVAVIASWSLLLAACSAAPVQVPAGQAYTSVTKAYDGDLKTYASQVTIDAILGHPGSKLVSSLPFPGCPGSAGLAIYNLAKATPASILLIGFTVRDGASITVSYTRPAGAKPDPGATAAMRKVICQV